MKKTLVMAAILAGAVGAYAQGTLNWNAQNNWLISVYSPQIATPSVVQTGNSAQDVPPGSTVYTGGWIGGDASPGTGVGPTPANGPGGFNYQTAANFTFGLYLDTTLSALTTDITTGAPVATGAVSDGGIASLGSVPSDPNIAAGVQVYVGLAAWYNAGGTIHSYAAAFAAQDPAGYSESSSTLGLSSLTGTPAVITPGIGLNSFSLAIVPEPSTVALAVMGASAFLLRLRRKN